MMAIKTNGRWIFLRVYVLVQAMGVILYGGCAKKNGSPPTLAEDYRLTDTMTVDLSGQQYAAAPRANGFLFGITPTSPDDKWIKPLTPPAFRFDLYGDNNIYERIRGWNVQKQVILSDMYDYPPWVYRTRPGTANGYAAWEARVGDIVDGNIALGWKGKEVEYDVWNEGDFAQFWDGSRADLQETWVRGAKVIRQKDPDALVVGPSFAYFDLDGITSFLAYAKQAGVTPDIISWHENHTTPASIQPHIDAYRASANNSIASRIQINEYGYTNETFIPGLMIFYIAELDRSQVDVAIRGCWDGCWDNDKLSGLLTDNYLPTPAWWVHKYYADMAAAGNTMITLSPHDDIDGMCSFTADHKLYLLIGNKSSDALRLPVVLKNYQAVAGDGWDHAQMVTIPNTGAAFDPGAAVGNSLQSSGSYRTIDLDLPAQSAIFVSIN